MPISEERSQTLDRGIRLLLLVASSGARGLSMTELARELQVGRPVVYRLVATLSDHDLLRRQDDGRVRMSLGIMRLVAATYPTVRQAALPILRELADAAGATAHLTVAEGDEAVAMVVVEPTWTDFHVGYRTGSRHSLDRGAAGKAILAGRHGDPSVVSTTGELQEGAHGLAAPLLGLPGLEASVGVVTVADLDYQAVESLVVKAAAAITAAFS